MPLEFFCCMTGTAEHEAVLRSHVMPSHLHLGLLMLGLQPGEPVPVTPRRQTSGCHLTARPSTSSASGPARMAKPFASPPTA